LISAKLEGGEAFTTEEQPKELDETEDVSDCSPSWRPA